MLLRPAKEFNESGKATVSDTDNIKAAHRIDRTNVEKVANSVGDTFGVTHLAKLETIKSTFRA